MGCWGLSIKKLKIGLTIPENRIISNSMMEVTLRENLSALKARYTEKVAVPDYKIGIMSANDGWFFKRIETTSFTVRTYDKVVNWFDANWPAGHPWPRQVPRPSRGGNQ
jgi:hypothetical protein